MSFLFLKCVTLEWESGAECSEVLTTSEGTATSDSALFRVCVCVPSLSCFEELFKIGRTYFYKLLNSEPNQTCIVF